jgi:hypothetical protein
VPDSQVLRSQPRYGQLARQAFETLVVDAQAAPMNRLVLAIGIFVACRSSTESATRPGSPSPRESAAEPTSVTGSTEHRHMKRTIVIYKEDRKVMTASNEPGPLISTALPPPGYTPPAHPFLSAQAHDPSSESALRDVLERSTSFDDFLVRLREAGYRVDEI